MEFAIIRKQLWYRSYPLPCSSLCVLQCSAGLLSQPAYGGPAHCWKDQKYSCSESWGSARLLFLPANRFRLLLPAAFRHPPMLRKIHAKLHDLHAFAFQEFSLQGGIRLWNQEFPALTHH